MPPRTQCPDGQLCKNYNASVISGPEGDGCMGPCARAVQDNQEQCPSRDDNCVGICLDKCARDAQDETHSPQVDNLDDNDPPQEDSSTDGEDGPWAHGWENRSSNFKKEAFERIAWLEAQIEQLEEKDEARWASDILQARIDKAIEFMEQSEAPFYKGLQALKGEQS